MTAATEIRLSDYSLVGQDAQKAVEQGLANADWYQCPVPRDVMRELLERRDGPAIRDTLLWFTLIFGTGYLAYLSWGTWWAIPAFALYGVLYGTTSDSRWHESSHGTAFKTDWMNNALYEIASFMVMRNATLWRWSHTRHHSDTIIVGRDPEIVFPRPADLFGICLGFFGVGAVKGFYKKAWVHLWGDLAPDEQTFVPQAAWSRVIWTSRIYLLIHALVIAASFYFWTILPALFILLPAFYGSWLMVVYGMTQHAGLAENVLDHRLNCRTVYMNFVNRYLYWNMNYHVEHHMFPLVPYHNLPRLHEIVKADMPTPYPGLLAAYQEIVPTLIRQSTDPGYFVRRVLPDPVQEASSGATILHSTAAPVDGWVAVCASADLKTADVVRFDHGGDYGETWAIYRCADGSLHATDGMCTHGRVHLAEGFLQGGVIECRKHNGRFAVADGSVLRAPPCAGLRTYPVRERDGVIELELGNPGGAGVALKTQTRSFRVVSNRNVATFIKELVLEPADGRPFTWQPGEYLQLDIPAYEEIRFADLTISDAARPVWEGGHVFDFRAVNPSATRRNYSIASNPASEAQLRFNVRIATPPPGQDCLAGAGSTWVWRLAPGDSVTAIGPFGNFHIKPTDREMVYIGGGAGMAPIRSHLANLLETQQTSRRVSYWYGARARQEVFYDDYFQALAATHPNFTFTVALSEPLPSDAWTGPTGFIHTIVEQQFLAKHPDPRAVEYYLCGPPKMVAAVLSMLGRFGVPSDQIACDEF